MNKGSKRVSTEPLSNENESKKAKVITRFANMLVNFPIAEAPARPALTKPQQNRVEDYEAFCVKKKYTPWPLDENILEYCASLDEQQLRTSTITAYCRYLRKYNTLHKGHAMNEYVYCLLKRKFDYLRRRSKDKNANQPIIFADVKHIIACIPQDFKYRNYMCSYMLFALNTGCRSNSICNFQLKDIISYATLEDENGNVIGEMIKIRISTLKGYGGGLDHQLQLTGYLDADQQLNVLHWLRLHLKENFNFDLRDRRNWESMNKDAYVWPKRTSKEKASYHNYFEYLLQCTRNAGYEENTLSPHGFRSGFFTCSLINATTNHLRRGSFMQDTSTVAHWKGKNSCMMNYAKSHLKNVLISNRLIIGEKPVFSKKLYDDATKFHNLNYDLKSKWPAQYTKAEEDNEYEDDDDEEDDDEDEDDDDDDEDDDDDDEDEEDDDEDEQDNESEYEEVAMSEDNNDETRSPSWEKYLSILEPSTKATHRRYDTLFCAYCDAANKEPYPIVNAEPVIEFIEYCTRGYSPSTIKRIVGVILIKHLCIQRMAIDYRIKYRIKQKLEEINLRADTKTATTIITIQDIDYMLKEMEMYHNIDAAYYQSMYLFAAYTGTRAITISQIKLDDIRVCDVSKNGDMVITISLDRSKSRFYSSHAVTIDGNINIKSRLDPVYWLNVYLKDRFNLELKSKSEWDEDMMNKPLWCKTVSSDSYAPSDFKFQSAEGISVQFARFVNEHGYENVKLVSFKSFRKGFVNYAVHQGAIIKRDYWTSIALCMLVAGWKYLSCVEYYISSNKTSGVISSNVIDYQSTREAVSREIMNPCYNHRITHVREAFVDDKNYQCFHIKVSSGQSRVQNEDFWHNHAYKLHRHNCPELQAIYQRKFNEAATINVHLERDVCSKEGRLLIKRDLRNSTAEFLETLIQQFILYYQQYNTNYKPKLSRTLVDHDNLDYTSVKTLRLVILGDLNLGGMENKGARNCFWPRVFKKYAIDHALLEDVKKVSYKDLSTLVENDLREQLETGDVTIFENLRQTFLEYEE